MAWSRVPPPKSGIYQTRVKYHGWGNSYNWYYPNATQYDAQHDRYKTSRRGKFEEPNQWWTAQMRPIEWWYGAEPFPIPDSQYSK